MLPRTHFSCSQTYLCQLYLLLQLYNLIILHINYEKCEYENKDKNLYS